jgi:hypothetical protein
MRMAIQVTSMRPTLLPKGHIDEMVAIHVMGWKWMRFTGTPINSHPDYPKPCAVRQLLSGESLKNKRWRDYLDAQDASEADGTEPLAYCYCSSCGPEMVPEYSTSEAACSLVEKRIKQLRLTKKMVAALPLVAKTPSEEKTPYKTTSRQICVAALAAVGAIQPTESDEPLTD